MVIRPLDANGDILPVSDLKQMASGKDAVGEVIDLRLNFFHGEWWEDRDIGFMVPEFLMKNIRSGDISLLANYVASYISQSPGVRAVIDVSTQYSRHVCNFKCAVLTTAGETVNAEVNLNGLL